MDNFRISYSVLQAVFRFLENSRQDSFKVQVLQLHLKQDLIYKNSNYSDFARTQGQEMGRISVFVAEQKTESLCLGYHKIALGMRGCVLGVPFKRNCMASCPKNLAHPVGQRLEQQADVPELVYQMSRHSLILTLAFKPCT